MGQLKTVTVVILSIVFVLAGNCHAEKIRLFTEQLAPVHFQEEGKVRGIATEIVRAIFSEAGLDPAIEVYPWLRSYQMALNIDNSFIYTIGQQRENHCLNG